MRRYLDPTVRATGLVSLAVLTAGCGNGSAPAGPRDAAVPDRPGDGPVVVTELPDGGEDCAVWGPSAFPSSFMATGQPCLECHDRAVDAAGAMIVAGTVFDRLHARDHCQGVGEVSVIVTDDEGYELRLQTNFAGNFYSSRELAFPITARVRSGDRVRRMVASVEHGDCNACHTADGKEEAPGRIVAP